MSFMSQKQEENTIFGKHKNQNTESSELVINEKNYLPLRGQRVIGTSPNDNLLNRSEHSNLMNEILQNSRPSHENNISRLRKSNESKSIRDSQNSTPYRALRKLEGILKSGSKSNSLINSFIGERNHSALKAKDV